MQINAWGRISIEIEPRNAAETRGSVPPEERGSNDRQNQSHPQQARRDRAPLALDRLLRGRPTPDHGRADRMARASWGDPERVHGRGSETRVGKKAMTLVLSLFPGIGLLDMAFEESGFCVVRGPD